MKIHGCEFLKLSDKSGFIQLVKWFLRYVIISGTEYTTNKNSLAYISLYTFASVHKAVQKLERQVYIGTIIDSMLETVTEDIIENPDKAEKVFSGDLLGGDSEWMKVAESLNKLDGFHRQIVVLYDIEMLSTGQISALAGISIEQLRIDLAVAEKQVADCLKRVGVKFDCVAEEINILGRMLDMDLISSIAESVGDYLEECE